MKEYYIICLFLRSVNYYGFSATCDMSKWQPIVNVVNAIMYSGVPY